MAFKVNDVEITSLLGTSIKTGRDSQNLIDFATTDNKLIFRVNNVNEIELVENALQPTTNDGVALGTTSLGWSDLHLASAGVLNWANGEMTITETDANTLTVAGGTFATAALTATTINGVGTATIDGDLTFTGTQTISTTAGALTVSPKEDVVFRVQDEDGTGVYGLYNFGGRNSGAGVASGLTITAAPSSSDDDYIRLVNVGDAHGPTTTWQRNKSGGSYNAAYMMGLAESDGAALHLRVNGTAGDFATGTLTMQWTSAGNINVPNGNVYIGDYENAGMTQGLTINQGAADNEAFALKSSDVAHGFTSAGYTTPETDTYFQIQKQNAALGGTTIASTAEDDAMTGVLTFYTQGGTASTTHSASGVGLVDFLTTEHNGSNARANITADGIVYSFRGRVGGANSSLFLIDEDGDTWQKGNAILGDGANVSISTPLLADADHTTTGLTAEMLAGGAISAFDLVCIHTVTGEVVEADASAYATARVIGIAPAAISDTATGTILLQGFIRDDTWNWTTGSTLYLSETAGAMTHTAPTTDGAFVQVVGVALEPDVVYINPSMTVIEHA